jgi:hypothetical protein
MTFPIVTYWRSKTGGPMPACYQLCWDTIDLHNPDAKLLTQQDVALLGGQEPLEAARGLPIAIEADLVRAWVLAKFGGMWVDLDSICLQPLAASLPPAALEADLVCVRNPRGAYWSNRITVASPYAARAGSPAAEAVYTEALRYAHQMRAGTRVCWGTTSAGVLSLAARQHADRVAWLHPARWHPVPSALSRAVFTRTGPRQVHVGHLSPAAVLVHLTNVIPDRCRDMSREQILGEDTFLAHLYQVALGLGPAIAPRTRSILQRIPRHEHSRGVEVGVFRALNACQLLQQRPSLQLLAVDGYGAAEASYAKTADYQARFDAERWAGVRNEAHRRVQWAGDRVTWSELTSVQAAAAVPDASVDWVWIDADHSEPAVRRDLAAWQPKVRPGGWIGGHDYRHPRARQRGYGVDAAVDCWAAESGVEIETGADTTWFAML